MSYSNELSKSLVDFLNTPNPVNYPQKGDIVGGKITATHSTYVPLEDPSTLFRRAPVVQNSTLERVAEIFEGLPPANQERLLEDIAHVDPVFLEASAGHMLYHHVLQPVKVVLNLFWKSYRDGKIAEEHGDDRRVLYLLKHFRYGFAIRSQHQDDSDRNLSRQDHILTFEPDRMLEDMTKTNFKPAGVVEFCTDLEAKTRFAELAGQIGSSESNEAEFQKALDDLNPPILVKDLPCLTMIIIEEKKPGTLSPNAWQEAHNLINLHTTNTAEANERKITGQIRGYAHTRKCPNVLVSQFDVNVLLTVDNTACELVLENAKPSLSSRGTAELTVDEDPQQHTPRAKVFYVVIERALRTMLMDHSVA